MEEGPILEEEILFINFDYTNMIEKKAKEIGINIGFGNFK